MSSKRFSYGQICWAKVRGFSEWPCMVSTYDSDTNFWRLGLRGNVEYYVEFFGDNFQFSWVTTNQLRIFEGNEKLLNNSKGLATAINSANNYFDKDLADREVYFESLRNPSSPSNQEIQFFF